ncbi:hypothetical protein KIN20_002411 [Parelaphostrongylus tenuis]|uniref:Uncharacterized protein n=1 Tax=Parelaphostrongylus tenuis TaxID=148309 RepID=A0AAD5LYH1_PARTN|nr:hypothetical protein KIN20_002411 [Parelaphostrongylus tenuis]
MRKQSVQVHVRRHRRLWFLNRVDIIDKSGPSSRANVVQISGCHQVTKEPQQQQIDLRQKHCWSFSGTEVDRLIVTCCKPVRPSTQSDTVSNWTVAIKQFHVTTSLSHFVSRKCKATRCQENKEEVDRFGLGAFKSSTIFARSASLRFGSLQIISALVRREKVSGYRSFASRIDSLACIEE